MGEPWIGTRCKASISGTCLQMGQGFAPCDDVCDEFVIDCSHSWRVEGDDNYEVMEVRGEECGVDFELPHSGANEGDTDD